MDKAQILEMIDLVEHAPVVRKLGTRFRDALCKANPDMTPEQIAVYEATFEKSVPEVTGTVHAARLKTFVEQLAPGEAELLESVLDNADFRAALSLLRRIGPVMAKSTQITMNIETLKAHRLSAEAAFELEQA